MELKVSDIASRVKGRVIGDGARVIRGAAGLAEAGDTDITFLKDAAKAGTARLFESTKAGAVLVPKGVDAKGRTLIEVDNPMTAFAQVLAFVAQEAEVRPEGIHPTAVVHPTARLGKNVRIGAHSVVEKGAVLGDNVCLLAQVYIGARSEIGEDSYFYPQVVVREDIRIGKRCIAHPGVVIGADGYGFFYAGGKHNKIPQVGTVVIQDDVEIGANSCIDRATTGATVIGKGTKIDNLVQVAHNVQVGEHCLLVAQVGIGGSSNIGAGAVIAGQAGVGDHVTIGAGAKIGAQGGAPQSIEAGAEVWGTPAQPIAEVLRQQVLTRRLPELFREFKKLKEMLNKHG